VALPSPATEKNKAKVWARLFVMNPVIVFFADKERIASVHALALEAHFKCWLTSNIFFFLELARLTS